MLHFVCRDGLILPTWTQISSEISIKGQSPLSPLSPWSITVVFFCLYRSYTL